MSEKRRCTGRNRAGLPCGNPPVQGALVCRMHGGLAPQVLAKAKMRLAEQEIRAGLAQLGVTAVEDPFTELSKLAGQVVSFKDQLAAKVNELTSIRYEAPGAGTEQLRAEVALFERALDRCAAVLGLIVKLDIDTRMARISERQADAVVRAVDAAISAAGITGPAALAARQVAARELRGVS